MANGFRGASNDPFLQFGRGFVGKSEGDDVGRSQRVFTPRRKSQPRAEWIFWNYYASVVWTETWTFCGKPCGLVDGIMDAEVAQIGAQHVERSPERVTYRNGYRNRTWDTRVGTMELHIPKLREGSYFPSLPEPRRRRRKP